MPKASVPLSRGKQKPQNHPEFKPQPAQLKVPEQQSVKSRPLRIYIGKMKEARESAECPAAPSTLLYRGAGARLESSFDFMKSPIVGEVYEQRVGGDRARENEKTRGRPGDKAAGVRARGPNEAARQIQRWHAREKRAS